MSAHTHQCWREAPTAPGLLYEGPRWIPERDLFQWVDILGHSILRWNPYTSSPVERRELPLEFVSVALPMSPSQSIVASRNTLHLYDWDTEALSQIAELEFADDIRFNDGGISPTGDVYIGTMSIDGRPAAGTLYKLAKAGDLEPILAGVTISNGLAWRSSDSAFYVDSALPQIQLLTWPEAHGDRPPQRSVFVDLNGEDEPDGLTVTPDGDLLVAIWQGSVIRRFSSQGEHVDDYPVPATFPTSVAIGGRNKEFTFITTAQHAEPGLPPRYGDGRAYYCDVRSHENG
ncbi:SMP-30/gluconolactonase/LRE family protein [uncultured Nocardioides sp.]|uniref:SMP-30/gluconolactonase/LRE family protein n=1 Tax=uncultured Nocardioides sp. TaxID=198441 RepID=UPI0026D101E7